MLVGVFNDLKVMLIATQLDWNITTRNESRWQNRQKDDIKTIQGHIFRPLDVHFNKLIRMF